MSQRAETCDTSTVRNDFNEGMHFLYTSQYLVASSPVSLSVYIIIPGSIQSSVFDDDSIMAAGVFFLLVVPGNIYSDAWQ